MKFSFGENWLSYSRFALDGSKIARARDAFNSLTDGIELRDARFLDIGFGQGLSLFLAGEAGADVSGIDLDPFSGEALTETHRFFPSLPLPQYTIASILDDAFVQSQKDAGGFDVVHSWGVLHHTGNMSKAFRNAAQLVKPGGFLIISIYNRHWTSRFWRAVKYGFNRAPHALQKSAVFLLYPIFYARACALARNDGELATRGMDVRHDLRDWLGGYPYEYASPAEMERTFSKLGMVLVRLEPTRGLTGCNEFVFRRNT